MAAPRKCSHCEEPVSEAEIIDGYTECCNEPADWAD